MDKMNTYKKFLENNKINKLKYFIFDFDDNLLMMDTPLHFQHFVNGKWVDQDINSEQFTEIRKKYPDNYMDNNEWKGNQKTTFVEFSDSGPRGKNAFMEDSVNAIKLKKFGPSWQVFLETLISGRLFSIVTTRGHEPNTIREVVEYIIFNVLSKNQQEEMVLNIEKFNKLFHIKTNNVISQYLNSCYFMGVTSKSFFTEFQYIPLEVSINKGKQDAINKFTNWVRSFSERTKLPLSVGFSDDDINYSNAAKELFMKMEKSLDFPEMFYVYDT